MQIFRLWLSSLCILTTCLLTACEKPVPNPETMDPIYQDLVSQLEGVKKSVAEKEKELEELEKSMEKLPPRDPELKKSRLDKIILEKRLVSLKQQVEFYELHVESRRALDRKNYLIAYSKKKPWPDKEEIAEYLAKKKLIEAPRDWSLRVPKPTPYTPPKGPEKKEDAGKGGGSKH